MANSRFEYVKTFEEPDPLLRNCWIVARIDGRKFHTFTKAHGFERPNDLRGLRLMNRCAKQVMRDLGDIVIAIGHSDEYSFVLKRDCTLWQRRGSKIITTIVSAFAANYVFYWSHHFPGVKLQYPPSFDGRIVLYPTDENVKDYLAWRQADCHINNLYNTCFWALVKAGMSEQDAEKALSGTLSKDKNELLFSRFGVNYTTLPAVFRKASVLIWLEGDAASAVAPSPADTDVEEGDDEEEKRTGKQGREDELRPFAAAPPASVAAGPPPSEFDAAGSSSAAIGTQSLGLDIPSVALERETGLSKEGKQAEEDKEDSAGVQRREGPPRTKRRLVVLHEDVFPESGFWQRFPGIIPTLTRTELRKQGRKRQAALSSIPLPVTADSFSTLPGGKVNKKERRRLRAAAAAAGAKPLSETNTAAAVQQDPAADLPAEARARSER